MAARTLDRGGPRGAAHAARTVMSARRRASASVAAVAAAAREAAAGGGAGAAVSEVAAAVCGPEDLFAELMALHARPGHAWQALAHDNGGSAWLWDVRARRVLREFRVRPVGHTLYEFDPAGARLAAGGDRGTVVVIDVERAVAVAYFCHPASHHCVSRLAWDATGARLVAVFGDELCAWDAVSGAVLWRARRPFSVFGAGSLCTAGGLLLVARDHDVEAIDWATGSLRACTPDRAGSKAVLDLVAVPPRAGAAHGEVVLVTGCGRLLVYALPSLRFVAGWSGLHATALRAHGRRVIAHRNLDGANFVLDADPWRAPSRLRTAGAIRRRGPFPERPFRAFCPLARDAVLQTDTRFGRGLALLLFPPAARHRARRRRPVAAL